MTDIKSIIADTLALISDVAEGERAAVLTTVSLEGRPHATWMGTISSPNLNTLVTITSPDSEKVENIRMNPNVEWMFTDESQETVIYLHGKASLVGGLDRIKKAWDSLPDKRRAFFLEFFNTGPGFAAIETRVESVIYCRPRENVRVELPLNELIENQALKARPGEDQTG